MPLLIAMPMGALLLDQDQSVRSVNQPFLDWLGYRNEQVVGRRLMELVLPTDASMLSERLADASTGCFELDLRFLSALGGAVLARVHFGRLPPQSTHSPGLLAVLRDPTDRDGIMQPDPMDDTALPPARMAYWELDMASGRLLVPPEWHAIWGLGSHDDISLQTLIERIHPLDRERTLSALRQADELGVPFRTRLRIARADGTSGWIEIMGRRCTDALGNPCCLRGSLLDISAQQEAAHALARYADIASASPDRIAFVDRGCRLLAANDAFLKALERPRQEVLDQPFLAVCGEGELTTLLYRHLSRCLDQAQNLVEDIRETTTSGDVLDLEVRLFPSRDASGRVTGIVINIRDVTAIRDAERRLLQSDAVYGATSEGVMITDPAGIIVAVNAAFTQITGYAEAEVLGQKPSLLNAQWHRRSFFVGMWRRLLRYGSWHGEIWNRRKDGEVYRQRLAIRRVLDRRGQVVNFVGVFAERGSSPNAPRWADHLIHYDALTKLPNRLLFESRLDHAIELGRRKESPLALLLIDLDHFAHINASLGYQIGDDLLRAIALKLRESIRPSDTLARLRADQFALFLEEVGQVEDVAKIARRLTDIMRAPIWVRGHQLHVTLSIGITVCSGSGEERNALIANAESALRRVKREGRNGFRILHSTPDQASQAHHQLLERLRAALGTPEIQLIYRPGMDMSNNRCDCISASIHWEPPELGAVPPERFLPLANESGLILELGNWALDTACRQLQEWLEQELPVQRLVIGISEAQITRGNLVRHMTHLLEKYPLIATRLELELSECLLVKHREQIAEILQGLNQLGIHITLGDVGIGWTAPAVLQRLPIRALKIHPSFIEALPNAHHELAVVEALIAMAQSLGLEVRADGVRTKEQQYQLLNIGCLKGQGDLFGAPLSASQLESWMNPKAPATTPVPLSN